MKHLLDAAYLASRIPVASIEVYVLLPGEGSKVLELVFKTSEFLLCGVELALGVVVLLCQPVEVHPLSLAFYRVLQDSKGFDRWEILVDPLDNSEQVALR